MQNSNKGLAAKMFVLMPECFEFLCPSLILLLGCCAADKESKTSKTRAAAHQPHRAALLKNSFVKFLQLTTHAQEPREEKKRVCALLYSSSSSHSEYIKML
jgi:hypothetical protein